jgi:hypothetical protein
LLVERLKTELEKLPAMGLVMLASDEYKELAAKKKAITWSLLIRASVSDETRLERGHHWYENKNGKRTFYAAAWIDGAQVHMHKYLCSNWTQVNHENGNGLDNRRENLRGVGNTD